MGKERASWVKLIFCTGLFALGPFSKSQAGLNRFTPVDEFEGWTIERKVDLVKNKIFCRASMPRYGTWFSARVRLDSQGDLAMPNHLEVSYQLNNLLKTKLKTALQNCRASLIYSKAD